MAAPHLVDIEVVSAWRRLVAAGQLEEHRAVSALADLRTLRIDRVRHARLIDRCWALRNNMTVYDAAYVALAELIQATLVTADAKFEATPGPTCEIEILKMTEQHR